MSVLRPPSYSLFRLSIPSHSTDIDSGCERGTITLLLLSLLSYQVPIDIHVYASRTGGGIEFNDCLGVSFRGSEDRSVSACSTTRILWRLQLPHDRCARNSAGTLAWIYCSTIAAAPHRQGTRCAHAGEVASSLSSTEAARGERTPASQPASKQAAAELE